MTDRNILQMICNTAYVHGLLACSTSGQSIDSFSDPVRPHPYLVHEVLTHGGGGGGGDFSLWKPNNVVSLPYETVTRSVSINGFLYLGAFTPSRSQTVILCFDVRRETFSLYQSA
ncbi:unnamed protein product [Cochlearia groenlandica]